MLNQRIQLVSVNLEHIDVINQMDVERFRADLLDSRNFLRGDKQRVAIGLLETNEHGVNVSAKGRARVPRPTPLAWHGSTHVCPPSAAS